MRSATPVHLVSAFLVSAFLFTPSYVSVEAAGRLETTMDQLEVERQLLAGELRQFSSARRTQQGALSRFEAALAAVDASIEGRQVSVESLESLERAVERTESDLDAANRRATRWRHRFQNTLRRTALLETRAEALSRGPGFSSDPLTGRWKLEVDPDSRGGFLDLRFSANLITGFYTLDDGSSASLRGTYSGGTLRLDRVDALRGFDAVWVGEVDLPSRTIAGTWTATELSSGGPVKGSWKATKIDALGAGDVP